MVAIDVASHRLQVERNVTERSDALYHVQIIRTFPSNRLTEDEACLIDRQTSPLVMTIDW